MSDPHQSFKAMVANSPSMRESWLQTVTQIQALAESEFNINLDADQILSLNCARLAVAANDHEQIQRWRAEAIATIPAIADAARKKDVKEALERGDDPLNTGGEPAMSIGEAIRRMNLARANGLTSKPEEVPKRLSPTDEALVIKRIMTLPPQKRLNEARRLGLGI